MVTHSTVRKPDRAQKAQRLVAFGHVHPTGRRNQYLVDSDSGSQQYRVEFGAGDAVYCSCVDWRRGYERTYEQTTHCKHAGAAALYRKAVRESFRPHAPHAGAA